MQGRHADADFKTFLHVDIGSPEQNKMVDNPPSISYSMAPRDHLMINRAISIILITMLTTKRIT